MNEQINARRVFEELVRTDFHFFICWAFQILFPGVTLRDNWHLVLVARYFEDIYTGTRKRILVCLPPRHLKSFIGSVCFPAWLLGRDPSAKVVCISYAQDISEGFAHQTRKLMESAPYRRIFPKTRIDGYRNTKRELGTTANGHRIAASVNGKLTGLGGDFLILDDPIKADDAFSDTVRESVNEWFDNTLVSRLDSPKSGRMVTIAQRLHVDDLPGRLITRGGWDQLILPLVSWEEQVFQIDGRDVTRPPGNILHEDHFGEAEAEEMRRAIPSMLFEAQWNQRPLLADGHIFKLEWLNYDEKPIPPKKFDCILQSWDTAVQTELANDYTVCITAGLLGTEVHILDVYRDKIDHPTQIKKVLEMRDRWSAHLVFVEGSQGGIALYQHHARLELPLRWLTYEKTTHQSKKERAEWQTPKLEQGRLFLPCDAPWRKSFENELTAFPVGKWDDQVDALTQLLGVLDHPYLRSRVSAVGGTFRG